VTAKRTQSKTMPLKLANSIKKDTNLAAWLRANEAHILPWWAREVRAQGREQDRNLGTQEFQEQHLLSFYDAVAKVAQTGQPTVLNKLLEDMVFRRVQEAYNIDEILMIPKYLRTIVRQHTADTEKPEKALAIIGALEPILDQSISILVHSFTNLTGELLSERLAEAEFMAQSLLEAGEEADRSLMQLRTLYNVSRELNQTVEIERTLGLIAEHLANVDKIDRCAIWLAGEDETLVVAVAHGVTANEMEGLTLRPSQRSFVSEAFRRRQYQVIEDRLDGRPLKDPLGKYFKMRSAIAMPLVSEGEAIGIVTADGLSSSQPFDASTIDMVRSVAEQAAIAIKTAGLYDQLTRFNQELEKRVEERTEELERAMRDLEHLDRTKSDFISIAAHELKTPLTLIRGYTNILREMLDPENKQSLELVRGIHTGIERLKDIIEDMIDITLIDTEVLTLHIIPTSLMRVVALALNEFEEAIAKRKHTIITTNLDKLPYIECDTQRLHQVLVNIIGNAIKYTPDKGRIEIAGRLLSGKQTGSADYVEITISDTGIGIDPEHHERIFDKFYQVGAVALHSSGKTKFKGGGPGLGLAIAKGVIEAHSGKIWVDSSGHDEKRCPGSTFHILLPVKPSRALGDDRVKQVLRM
jgi:signal transduction histidine kinase